MILGNIVLVSRNVDTYSPKIGDFCKNNLIKLFQWTKKHEEFDVLNTLPEFKYSRVVEPYFVEIEELNHINEGDMVLTGYGVYAVSAVNNSFVFCENTNKTFHISEVKRIIATPSQMAKIRIVIHDDSDMPCGIENRDIIAPQLKRIVEENLTVRIESYVTEKGEWKPNLLDGKVIIYGY